MTDDEKDADIDAEYNRVLRELMANKDPWLTLAAILLDRDADSAQGGRAEAVPIEKITTVTPDPPPETTIEKPKLVCSVISLSYIPNINWQEGANIITAAGSISALPSTVKQSTIARDFDTGGTLAIAEEERCGTMYVLGQPRTGKPTLLISLALADIEKRHGLFFIHPTRTRSMILSHGCPHRPART